MGDVGERMCPPGKKKKISVSGSLTWGIRQRPMGKVTELQSSKDKVTQRLETPGLPCEALEGHMGKWCEPASRRAGHGGCCCHFPHWRTQ